ncbi:LETM1-related biofilm-associated protein [Aurantibacter sp.]|uniref:LETM1-related biofilm-associated protein n=1 Tax=Aurantibacter sp. TaxID=2807103 RepID=UPI0032653EB9
MNPSASGWIDKYGHLVKDNLEIYIDFRDLYVALKKTGFVYGINVKTPSFIVPEHTLSEDEIAKINLLTSLFFTYKIETQNSDFDAFLNSVLRFYDKLEVGGLTFLSKLFVGNKTSTKLEKLIDSRVYLEDNMLSKTFNSIITNSLLFIDVLTYNYHLTHDNGTKEHAQLLEFLTINTTYYALNSKEINKSDERLAHLFEASLTFVDFEKQTFDGTYREKLVANNSEWENRYFLDIACLTVWEDQTFEYQESEFIHGIGRDLKIAKESIKRALVEITDFFAENADIVPFLKDNNLAVQFYDSMAKVVDKLISRNSKRLKKELLESKELVALLTKSTIKDLDEDEKKKVQNQLIDIFKSIPSLAIFLLPGGAVLLPIFIKLIPKLLPSAFDDNRVDKTK